MGRRPNTDCQSAVATPRPRTFLSDAPVTWDRSLSRGELWGSVECFGELDRRHAVERAVRPNVDVVLAPNVGSVSSFGQVSKTIEIEEFVADSTVYAFDVRVLRRLPWVAEL